MEFRNVMTVLCVCVRACLRLSFMGCGNVMTVCDRWSLDSCMLFLLTLKGVTTPIKNPAA
jgi:hypothetical protein